LGVQYLGLITDDLLLEAQNAKGAKRFEIYEEAIELMKVMDKLLASHPNHKLENWVNLARNFGDTYDEKQYYESNAKRLITTWGGGVNEYAARTWNGVIGTYYAPRWQAWLDAERNNSEFEMLKWEEEWIQSEYISDRQHYDDPVKEIIRIINN
ncbi:MAG: alpha-N-acetylglucosaminidase C-terminal domain-containing protein, partial [Bacteroidales bacterium]|nr:alpha-N-acetylglucosaminidase C-terminal domain-containing protein [Bacteroidales bacterium]